MADIVEGRYRILKKLGEGGMGAVYLAEDERLGRQVALKRLRIIGASEEMVAQFLERFRREARAMARMQHPSIITVLDYGVDDAGAFLVMEYLPNGTLKDRMGQPVAVREAVGWLEPIAEALGYLHQRGMVHRDVKPANILFDENDRPMLADFGIVKLMEGDDGATLTATGAAVGTPAYMAPELIGGEASAQSDQYALGVILYELLTGKKPFEGRTPFETLTMQKYEALPDPRKYQADLSEGACALLSTALAKEAGDRYASMKVFGGALEKILSPSLGNEPSTLRQATVAEPVEATFHPSTDSGTAPSALRDGSVQASSGQALRHDPVQAGSENVFLTQPVEEETMLAESVKASSLVTIDEGRSARRPKTVWLLAGVGVIVLGLAIGLGGKLVSPGPDDNGAEAKWMTETISAQVTSTATIGNTLAPVATDAATPTTVMDTLDPESVAYVVQAGDSCSSIATAFGVSIADLVAANSLDAGCTQIFLGDTLIIPVSPDDGSASGNLGIGSTRMREMDGMEMVYVPEGVFTMGSEEGDIYEQPAHEVYLDAYWIDMYEVTNEQYEQCVAAGACTKPYKSISQTRDNYYMNPEYGNFPVVYVDWYGAAAYCEWVGGGLPTEAQWEKAARGVDGRMYPWGNDPPTCSLANFNPGTVCLGDTSRVGSNPAGVSPYGAFDMAGNVWEWVLDWWDEAYYQSSPVENPTGPVSGEFRVMRGGSWINDTDSLLSASRVAGNPYWDWYDYGFRCAMQVDEVEQSTETPDQNTDIGPGTVREKDGMEMMYIPAGNFFRGHASYAEEVYLPAFWIDKFEVTNKQYALCVNENICSPPDRQTSYTRQNYWADPEFGDFPVIYITKDQAEDYCFWVNGRLPESDEWEKAARGTDLRLYPWGNDIPSCQNSNILGCRGDTSLTGSFAQNLSPYGVMDMVGNVWEWDQSGYGRGGAWDSESDGYTLTVYHRHGFYQTIRSFDIGFRCVMNAD
ncbi:MAG: SUMF1/EgtB/PvdO family nonheme iron enzyme [Anaerolineae bacterium]|nr:SUMF1/EgtB/PvdO family nonheme iron enzyme [Anaerolineae bacterium]